MKEIDGAALAVENCCALVIRGDEYKIINSKKEADAFKTFWRDDKYYTQKIKVSKNFKPIEELLTKSL